VGEERLLWEVERVWEREDLCGKWKERKDFCVKMKRYVERKRHLWEREEVRGRGKILWEMGEEWRQKISLFGR